MALNWENSGLLALGSEPGRQLIERRRPHYKMMLKKRGRGRRSGRKERRGEGRERERERGR